MSRWSTWAPVWLPSQLLNRQLNLGLPLDKPDKEPPPERGGGFFLSRFWLCYNIDMKRKALLLMLAAWGSLLLPCGSASGKTARRLQCPAGHPGHDAGRSPRRLRGTAAVDPRPSTSSGVRGTGFTRAFIRARPHFLPTPIFSRAALRCITASATTPASASTRAFSPWPSGCECGATPRPLLSVLLCPGPGIRAGPGF